MSASKPLWYHLTDRARFRLDAKFAPADNAIAIEDRSGRPGIYLGRSVERWVNGQGYWRPFVVEFEVDPAVADDPGVHGRYGGELFVPATSFKRIAIKRVIPLDAHARETYGTPGWIEYDLGRAFDTGEPLTRHHRFPGYRYAGPDVRKMEATEVARLRKQLRDRQAKVKRGLSTGKSEKIVNTDVVSCVHCNRALKPGRGVLCEQFVHKRLKAIVAWPTDVAERVEREDIESGRDAYERGPRARAWYGSTCWRKA